MLGASTARDKDRQRKESLWTTWGKSRTQKNEVSLSIPVKAMNAVCGLKTFAVVLKPLSPASVGL